MERHVAGQSDAHILYQNISEHNLTSLNDGTPIEGGFGCNTVSDWFKARFVRK